jgi:hypothetical protein
MNFLVAVYLLTLLASSLYALLFGGRTGRAAVAIFGVASGLTSFATQINPNWVSTSYGVFMVDAACLLALLLLALVSNRYWPIWAVGFQTISVATHLATIVAPDILPKAYQAIAAFWSLPILAAMVVGTTLDWRYTKRE